MAKEPALYNEASSREREGKKVLESLTAKPSENGGHTITHHYKSSNGMGYFPSEDHTFGKGQDKDVIKHLVKHLGLKQAKAEANAQDHDEEMDTEEEGGKASSEDKTAKGKVKKAPKRSKAEEKGED